MTAPDDRHRMTVLRVIAGAAVGVLAWVALDALFPILPSPVRFAAALLFLTFACGALPAVWLMRDRDLLQRTIVALGAGTAAAALFIDVFGRLGLVSLFPFAAAACAGAAAVMSRRTSAPAPRMAPGDLAACAVIVAVALGTGAIAFAHRLVATPTEVAVYGNYDTLDLAYYAAITAEASHTIPPTAPNYSGHGLNYAYYPQLILAVVHRVAAVPILDMYFRWAWPLWLAIGGLMTFVTARLVLGTVASLLATVLLLVAGDFSYLAAWSLPHQNIDWDFLLWPTNFLSPTMEVLHFNSWTPSLPIFFAVVFGTARSVQTGRGPWFAVTGLLLAVLFQFKPFAFVVLMAALAAAAVLSFRDPLSRKAFGCVVAVALVAALPFAYRSMALYADRRSELKIAFFLLPERMLIKLDLTDAFASAARSIAPIAWLQRPLFLALATALFLAVGFGVRWLALPPLWRALRGNGSQESMTWRFLALIACAGVAIPFVLVTEPYNDTLQFYQVGLYMLWFFTAAALTSLGRTPGGRAAAAALALAVSLPSSLHYLSLKWSDRTRAPLMALNGAEVAAAEHLARLPAAETVILHDRPLEPSLINVLSARRVVLAWGRYAVGSDGRRRDVDRFFRSAEVEPSAALDVLQRYRVTHVIDRPSRDRVHPAVLARLTPLLRFPDLVLYSVPPELSSVQLPQP